jgi:hypothetical protein
MALDAMLLSRKHTARRRFISSRAYREHRESHQTVVIARVDLLMNALNAGSRQVHPLSKHAQPVAATISV